jgi:putative ABC transport system substrate-binding protein
MDRRTFIGTLAGGLLAAPLAAEAQPAGKVYRVALVFSSSPVSEMAGTNPPHPHARAFFQGLRDRGYVEGQNIIIERRSEKERSSDSARFWPNWFGSKWTCSWWQRQ